MFYWFTYIQVEMGDHDDIPKLKDLVIELNDIATVWQNLGIQLGLTAQELQLIAKTNPFDIKAQLRLMLVEWLKKVNPRPSWKALIDALRTAPIKQHQLADMLEKKYLLSKCFAIHY